MPYLTRSCRFVTAMALFTGLLLGARDAAAADRGASLAPAGWDSGLKLKEPVDRNPDPSILEIYLAAKVAEVEVAPGLRVKAWTYDGGLPGPLIRAKVGDRVVVHFTNELSEPTTIHWHGVRVPIEMDGVPNISQPEVKTGETFTYEFVVRSASWTIAWSAAPPSCTVAAMCSPCSCASHSSSVQLSPSTGSGPAAAQTARLAVSTTLK